MGVSNIIARAGASLLASGTCRCSDALFDRRNGTLGVRSWRRFFLFVVN